MRNSFIIVLIFFFSTLPLLAQENLTNLLISGTEDTQRFLNDYLGPGTRGLIYNRAGGWYQGAEVKDPLGFEISLIANGSVNLDQHQSFILNIEDYKNIQFPGGETQKEVATILGENDPAVQILLRSESGGGETSFELPQGIGAAGANIIPTAFLQGRLGLFRGTEVKVRYLPRREFEGANFQILGGAIQHEFTQWLAPGSFPLAVSGMVVYSVMDGEYDFTNEEFVEGTNQRLDSKMDYLMFSGIVSTKFRVVNLYGGISYLSGTSETKLLGTYEIEDNSGETIATLTDPLSLTSDVAGLTANLGLSLRWGFFKVHTEYNFSEFQTISAGVHVGF